MLGSSLCVLHLYNSRYQHSSASWFKMLDTDYRQLYIFLFFILLYSDPLYFFNNFFLSLIFEEKKKVVVEKQLQ